MVWVHCRTTSEALLQHAPSTASHSTALAPTIMQTCRGVAYVNKVAKPSPSAWLFDPHRLFYHVRLPTCRSTRDPHSPAWRPAETMTFPLATLRVVCVLRRSGTVTCHPCDPKTPLREVLELPSIGGGRLAPAAAAPTGLESPSIAAVQPGQRRRLERAGESPDVTSSEKGVLRPRSLWLGFTSGRPRGLG